MTALQTAEPGGYQDPGRNDKLIFLEWYSFGAAPANETTSAQDVGNILYEC